MQFVLKRLPVVVLAVLAMSAVAVSPAWAAGKPFVETQPATSVSAHEAILHGVVNPNGAETTYWFEYGLTMSYGKKTAEVKVGSGTTNKEESQVISELASGEGTTYHFRIVAKNVNGTSDGADEVFKTLSSEGACRSKDGGKKYGLCVEKEAPASATAEWATVGSPEAYVVEVTGESAWRGSPINCQSLSAKTVEIASGESLSLKQRGTSMAGCKISGKFEEQCRMPAELGWNETHGTFAERPEMFSFANAVGEEHSFFEFATKAGKGECPAQLLSGAHALKGAYKCKVHEAEVETVTHTVVCEGDASMTFSSSAAKSRFEASLALTGTDAGKKFRIYEHN